MLPTKEPRRFYACRPCWRTRSGVEPTRVGGRSYRPVAWYSSRRAECRFCGTSTVGVYRYEEVPK